MNMAFRSSGTDTGGKLRTVDETAELFGTSTGAVRRFIEFGALPARWLVMRSHKYLR